MCMYALATMWTGSAPKLIQKDVMRPCPYSTRGRRCRFCWNKTRFQKFRRESAKSVHNVETTHGSVNDIYQSTYISVHISKMICQSLEAWVFAFPDIKCTTSVVPGDNDASVKHIGTIWITDGLFTRTCLWSLTCYSKSSKMSRKSSFQHVAVHWNIVQVMIMMHISFTFNLSHI